MPTNWSKNPYLYLFLILYFKDEHFKEHYCCPAIARKKKGVFAVFTCHHTQTKRTCLITVWLFFWREQKNALAESKGIFVLKRMVRPDKAIQNNLKWYTHPLSNTGLFALISHLPASCL
jgi:hypothetical protein